MTNVITMINALQKQKTIGKPIHDGFDNIPDKSFIEKSGYRFEKILGEGSFGIVLKLQHIKTKTYVAGKFFFNKDEYLHEAGIFVRLGRVYTDLNQYIISVFEIFDYPEKATIIDIAGKEVYDYIKKSDFWRHESFLEGGIIIMELMDGSLRDHSYMLYFILKNENFNMQLHKFLDGAEDACKKEHFYHGDLKLRNILYRKVSNDTIEFKLSDLGLSLLPPIDSGDKALWYDDMDDQTLLKLNNHTSQNYTYNNPSYYNARIEFEWDMLKFKLSRIEEIKNDEEKLFSESFASTLKISSLFKISTFK